MAAELVMPKWGLSMREGLITRWLKQEGDSVEKGEAVLEVPDQECAGDCQKRSRENRCNPKPKHTVAAQETYQY